MTTDFRVERDSMGELKVPAARSGARRPSAQSKLPDQRPAMPRAFIRALGLIKWAAADANRSLRAAAGADREGDPAAPRARSRPGKHDEQFPIDVFQTGSGTSSNMNANEVIANLATKRCGSPCIRTITSTWARAATT